MENVRTHQISIYDKTSEDMHITEPIYLKDYLLGGFAIITIGTGKISYTYKVCLDKKWQDFYYIFRRNKHGKWIYLGAYDNTTNEYRDNEYGLLPKNAWPQTHQLICYILQHLDDYTALSKYDIYHYCICSRCGRKLTNIDSIKRGIGLECLERSKNEQLRAAKYKNTKIMQ